MKILGDHFVNILQIKLIHYQFDVRSRKVFVKTLIGRQTNFGETIRFFFITPWTIATWTAGFCLRSKGVGNLANNLKFKN